ncbi:MAG: hypothetical protein GWP09_00360 [Nitrospiraceae bacterium]|nr:hypothetical protein [Nitrospiraceae bacterium]
MVSADLLFKYGFLNSKGKSVLAELKENGTKIDDYIKQNRDKLSDLVDEEKAEILRGTTVKTGFPTPAYRHHLVFQSYNLSIEEAYFWILRSIEESFGFPNIDKIVDMFAASESSSFFGVSSQRIGLQQDKASQFLATIGRMIKDLFKLVRELRVLDERLTLYEESFKGNKSSDVVLKGIWIDFVEGGSKNPASVYGMAREVGFVTLPDLFFDTFAKDSDDVDNKIKQLEGKFNKAVIRVLERKLKSYYTWKKMTYNELKTRRTFSVKYLYQHYKTIQMYISWVKPYLRNIERLTMDNTKFSTPHLVSAFENSMIEVEFLAQKPLGKNPYVPCVLATFNYRTQPSLSYQQEGYQRGPIHVGRVEITLRAYVWNKSQIENYKKMRQAEDLQILSSIDSSLKAALEALGDDIEKYIEEAEKGINPSIEKKKEETRPTKPKTEPMYDPFLQVFLGFKEIFGAFVPNKKPGSHPFSLFSNKKSYMELKKDADAKKSAKGLAKAVVSVTYETYKKAHGMLAW